MNNRLRASLSLLASCSAIFWPGALIFSFPGVMGAHWQATFTIGRAAIGQTLFFVLAAVGIFMFLIGRWQEKIGPAWLTAIGITLCGTGTILLGYAADINHVYLWAFVTGISSAFIYLPALTVAQRWYPLRRGLVSGLVNMVFGFSAAIMSPLFAYLLQHIGYTFVTFTFGLITLVIGLASAPFICLPKTSATAASAPSANLKAPGFTLNVSQSIRTRTFWFIWFTWALTGAAGISMVPLSTAFGKSVGLPIQHAVLILTGFNVTNGLSRLISGHLSDIIGRNITMMLAFLAAGSAYLLMPLLQGLVIWITMAAAVGFAFGTLFAVSAPLVGDCFGLGHFGSVFGLIFTAYGFLAGVLGPWLSGFMLDTIGGNFKPVFWYLALFCYVSSVFIWHARPPQARS